MSRKIGILGGMSPESTAEYYRLIIRKYVEKKNDFHFPEVVIYSVDFGRMMELKEAGNEQGVIDGLANAIGALERAGADFIIIAANTPHLYLKELGERATVPIVSIVKATLDVAKEEGLKRLLLMGTMVTMRSDFYSREARSLGIEIIAPKESEQETIENIIFDELALGIIKEESKNALLDIINNYTNRVDGVVLGCTELPLIVHKGDSPIELLNTTEIHAKAALEYSLKKS